MDSYILLVLSYAVVIVCEGAGTAQTTVPKVSHENLKLLPGTQFCGYQHTDDRFSNETEVALDEFPWLVHVRLSEAEYEIEFGDRCSGVLISKRYVLTNAYCGAEAVKVRLGQYRTNETVSCIEQSHFHQCSDSVVEVKVAEIIRDGQKGNGAYDFTLLRLAETVTFTDFIRPICLPIEDSKVPDEYTSVVFSGWGASGPQATTKKKLTYNVADSEVCYKQEVGLEGNVKFSNVSLICAVPQDNNTDEACSGDHGGPFMYGSQMKGSDRQWFAVGTIVDFSADNTPVSCSADKSINGIKITPKTIEWILNNIRD